MSMYEAVTGNWILDVANSTTSGLFMSQEDPYDIADGSLLEYYINNTDHTIVMWNSTRCVNGGQMEETRIIGVIDLLQEVKSTSNMAYNGQHL